MTPKEAEGRIERDSIQGNLAGGHCPFCRKEIIFPRTVPRGEEGYVMHAAPPCETYKQSTPYEFMLKGAAAKLAAGRRS